MGDATLHKTVCNRDCPDACGIVATVKDGRVVKLGGDPDHPVTRGFLCWRTNHFLGMQYGPSRLTTPLLRTRAGTLAPVSWETALDFAAEKLSAIKQESGPAAIFHYRSGGSLGLLGALTDYLFELFGPVTIKRGDICGGAGDAAQTLDFGVSESSDLFGLLASRQIILWGKNAVVSSPHTFTLLKQAAAAGTELTLVDPLRHRTADAMSRHWQPRPGGDFALAMAVAQTMWSTGFVTSEAEQLCDNVDAFRALAFSRTRQAWCVEADVPEEAAEDLARRLADRPCAILVGWGIGRRASGGALVRALDALGVLSGNLGLRGGGVSYYFRRRGAFDTSFVKGAAVAPRTILEPCFGASIEAAQDPPIRAVWITAGNPVAMLPDSAATVRALQSRELVVVVDPFMTDTAELADLVLPTTTLLEADDLIGAYGHHLLGVARPVVAPPEGVLSDLQIAQALATRWGFGDRLAGSAREWKERFLRPAVKAAGVTIDALELQSQRNPLAPSIVFEGGRVSTPSGKTQLVTDGPPPFTADTEFPLFLMSVSTDRSQSSQWSVEPEGLASCTVHPEIAAAAGLVTGDEAWLVSRLGRLRVKVLCDDRQRRDVAIVPKGGSLRSGRCANALVRARITDIGEGGALYDEVVRLTAV